MDKKTVRDLDVAGKKVLVRVDFNVPLNDKGPQQTIPVYSDLLLRELFRGKRKIRFQARHLLCPRYDAYYRRIPENLQ